jgi:alkanesulfonate monooxygenase SsuD/methylene tetrahydromethanopterin reductase-like flavin-dependent oxidoreductase (luciferase family)
VKLGDQLGFHSFWSVEHHFLEEYSHCSNPEVLYGHLSAVTKNLKLGYGVRLLPKPYNHPVRTAESVAVLDLISNGRVLFGKAARPRARARGLRCRSQRDARDVGQALRHIVACWTQDEVSFEGKHWRLPKRRVLPKLLQDPHPPIFGATSSVPGHYEIGSRGIGLCSFTVGQPPEQLAERIEMYRKGQKDCAKPVGAFRNETAATFTMVHCAETNAKARADAEESFVWYPKTAGWHIASLAEWMEERKQDLGNYQYAGDALQGKARRLDGPAQHGLHLGLGRSGGGRPRSLHPDQ